MNNALNRILESRKTGYAVVILGLLLIVGAAQFFVEGSIVPGSKADSLQFSHITEDAGISYDPSEDYPVLSDSAVIGDYRVNVVEKGAVESGDGCMIGLDVSRNGEQVFSGDLVNGIAGTSNRNLKNAFSSEGLKHVRTTHYMDYDTWYGNGQLYVISQECGGAFLTYEMPINFSEIGFSVEAAKQVRGDNFTAVVDAENGWKPLKADLVVEACTEQGFCVTEEVEKRVPTGGDRFEVVLPTEGENLSVSMTGDVYLDMKRFSVSGVNIMLDGERRDASNVSQVKIAEVTGSDSVEVVEAVEAEEPTDTGGNGSQPSSDASGFFSGLWDSIWRILTFG